MARKSQVIYGMNKIGRWVFAPLIFFFLTITVAHGANAAPFLEETKWRTGELEISYTGAHIGYMIVLYAATYDTEGVYNPVDTWFVTSESGTHVTKPFENGQTVWYYVKQYDPITGDSSSQSNLLKQTPPITAYIINWPDMLNDLNQVINNAMTPSNNAINDLKDALDDLKKAVGAGQAASAGGAIKDGLDGVQGGMHPPLIKNPEEGTYTGGAGGFKLPQTDKTNGGLTSPDPDSGTSNEVTMRIPWGVDMSGNLLYVKIFTNEQMEKMKWFGLLRTLIGITMWIIFAIWLVQRFTPQLKV